MNYFATGLDYFIKGGPVMYPLLLCSIAAIAICVERYLFFKKADSGIQPAVRLPSWPPSLWPDTGTMKSWRTLSE